MFTVLEMTPQVIKFMYYGLVTYHATIAPIAFIDIFDAPTTFLIAFQVLCGPIFLFALRQDGA